MNWAANILYFQTKRLVSS